MAPQIIPAAQLVPKFQGIRRCNNYAVLQSIPCSPECKIVGQILLDHLLSYALTATADVSAVHLQQFWKIVHKVPDTKDTIRFKLDYQDITYTLDMFHDTLKLPVETLDNPFITSVTIRTIESFMQTVSYQGVVDKVSAFYMKFLAQPWQTMFKVFNCCLTTRTSGHDLIKINILQLFHTVVNHTNIDYAALLWWDFMNNVFQNKNVIQYPRFIQLIIANLMEKYPSIPQRHDEDYHSIKDDTLLVSVYSTWNVLFRGMRITDAFLTAKICATDDYKEYEIVFIRLDVPMNQPQLVVSTQGTHKTTPRAHRTPTLTTASPQGKKRKQSARKTSSLRKSLKVTTRQKKQSTPLIPPPSDDRVTDDIAEATLLSLTLHKTTLAAKAQENVAKVKEKLAEEEIEKMVEGEEDEESYVSEFANSMLNDDDVDDFDDATNEEEVKDDDVGKIDDAAKENDNDDHTDHTLVETYATGSMETRNEQTQTPIPTPIRSPRKDLSSDKTISEELTTTVSPTTATTSLTKSKKGFTSNKTKILPGGIASMIRRREVLDHCNNVVSEMTFAKTNEMIKEEMPHLVNLAVNKDREINPINVPDMISKEFATNGPKMIEEQFQKHMQNTAINLYPTTSSSTAKKSTADLQQLLYLNMNSKPQDQAADLELWEILKSKFEKP
ncbi:hypothetical protein Tco_1153552 [Tanacetum coccineum]